MLIVFSELVELSRAFSRLSGSLRLVILKYFIN